MPSVVLLLSGGWAFTTTFGSLKGYFLCILAINLGYAPGCLFTFFISKKCFYNYMQKNVIGEIRVFKAIDNSMKQHPVKLCILLGLQPVLPR